MNFQKMSLAAGLYFVAVPIGTARDITLRALDVLACADTLVAEDTRSLRRLMDIHGIPLEGRKILSFHDHSKQKACNDIVSAIAAGHSVAYASEAGMPLIADPGFELGVAARDAGHSVSCIPGPSAALTALVLSGLPTDAFHFSGFLPNSRNARRAALQELGDIPATLIFFESPKRLAALLEDAEQVLGPRMAAVCRELTKKFEEARRGTLTELLRHYTENAARGEVVVLIDRARSEKIMETDLEDDLVDALKSHSLRDAVDLVAQSHDVPRRRVYKLALALSKG